MTARLSSLADFRRLWFVGFVICVVRWLETLAFGLFAYQVTGSAFVVAMLTMLRLLPMGLFGAFLGAAAERFERRRALILVVATSMAITLVLAILASLGAIQVWHLALASFINGIGWASDHPVRRMMIGDVVGADRIGSALSIDTATNNASRVLGPMLSGLLLWQYGIVGVFWFSLALYAPSVVAALRVRAPSQAAAGNRSSFITSIREGLAWVRRDRPLRGVFSITVIFNVFGWPFNSMIPVIGTDYLHLQAKGVGLLASCDGVGGLIGALVVAGLVRPAWYGRLYVGSVAVYLVMVIGFVTATEIPVAAVCLFLSGMCGAGFAVLQATLVYRSAPVEMRARLLGVLSVCIGTAPLGFLYLGFLGDLLTPRIGTLALAAQGMLALLLTRRYWTAALRL